MTAVAWPRRATSLHHISATRDGARANARGTWDSQRTGRHERAGARNERHDERAQKACVVHRTPDSQGARLKNVCPHERNFPRTRGLANVAWRGRVVWLVGPVTSPRHRLLSLSGHQRSPSHRAARTTAPPTPPGARTDPTSHEPRGPDPTRSTQSQSSWDHTYTKPLDARNETEPNARKRLITHTTHELTGKSRRCAHEPRVATTTSNCSAATVSPSPFTQTATLTATCHADKRSLATAASSPKASASARAVASSASPPSRIAHAAHTRTASSSPGLCTAHLAQQVTEQSTHTRKRHHPSAARTHRSPAPAPPLASRPAQRPAQSGSHQRLPMCRRARDNPMPQRTPQQRWATSA